MKVSPIEGVGNAECPLHPQPRVRSVESTRVFTTVAPEHPAFPHAMVLTAYVVLSPVTGLFCHRRQRIKVLSKPGGPTQLRRLDASVGASGPHDFAVRSNISRRRAVDRSQIFRLALQSHRAQNAAASTASRPASVTIAIRPSVEWDGEGCRCDLGRAKTEIFLQTGLDRWNQKTDRSTSLPCARTMRRECAPSPCGISTCHHRA